MKTGIVVAALVLLTACQKASPIDDQHPVRPIEIENQMDRLDRYAKTHKTHPPADGNRMGEDPVDWDAH